MNALIIALFIFLLAGIISLPIIISDTSLLQLVPLFYILLVVISALIVYRIMYK
ncbi:hypothetical protein [Sulfolobus spindle-shaped virus]|nr:hypothetical protein [Sulfolobus spindle-shaped virus]